MIPNFTYRARVLNVVDGDTIDVDLDAGFTIRLRLRLRLLRVNTPELRSSDPAVRERAMEAKVHAEEMLKGRDIIVRTEKDDAFGRYLAEVWYADMGTVYNFNDELLKLGLAVPYVK